MTVDTYTSKKLSRGRK